jgi:hypothetical protein
LETITPCRPPGSLRKLVSRTRIDRDKLRREYTEILIEALQVISTLDVRDNHGKIVESGATIIDSVLTMERQRKDISEQIQIIGRDKWLKLKKLWNRMREIETEDKTLISKPK